jgi:hypothetical protein
MRNLLGILLLANLAVFLWYGFNVGYPWEEPKKPRLVDVGDLRLSNEGGITAKVQTAVEPPPVEEQSKPKEVKETVANLPVETCWRLGSYDSRQAAKNAADGLPDGVALRRIGDDIRTEHQGFHVFVPPAESMQQASNTLERLRREKVPDIWLMKSGPYQYSVSLGVFDDRENALKHMRYVQEKGFNASVRERIDEKTHYWLEVAKPSLIEHEKLLREHFSDKVVARPCGS